MKRILVVDDDPAFRRLMRKLIEAAGYELEEAKDGLEAIDAIKKRVPDLILLDIVMPFMDGYQVMHHVRFDKGLPVLPIIVVSNKDRETISRMGGDLEGVDYYNKETSLRTIMERIEKFFKCSPNGVIEDESIGGENVKDIKAHEKTIWDREQRMIEDYIQESLRKKADRDRYLRD